MMDESAAREVIEEALSRERLSGRKVLVVTPDDTRSGPTAMVFKLLADLLLPEVSRLDFMPALGTHQPLSEEAKNRLYGITQKDRQTRYAKVSILDHEWWKEDAFQEVGIIPAQEMEELSGGMIKEAVPVKLNRAIFSYDHIIIYGPVFPHEVAGFSGGHKYFFPGIAGREIIDFTHWLGALITNYEIIGKRETPVRAVIERAASMVEAPRTGICAVVEENGALSGLFAGEVKSAWEKAADLSASTHIKWMPRPFKLVVSVMPERYHDLWTGAKGMYKVEPVVEDGGEVIIYAPHIKEVSYTHGKLLDEIGYHVRDYFLAQWERFRAYPGCVLAHSTHLKGLGRFENGREIPRVRVALATGIPEERCRRLSVGYRSPAQLSLESFKNREQEGILLVENAGEILYRLESQRKEEK